MFEVRLDAGVAPWVALFNAIRIPRSEFGRRLGVVLLLRFRQRLAASLVLMLWAGAAQAALVRLDFSATVGAISEPGYTALLTPGELMTGSVVFDFNPPSVFSIDPSSISGSYTVSSGTGLVDYLQGGTVGPTAAGLNFFGAGGPSNLLSGVLYSLGGFSFRTEIDGDNASLSDYLALTASDITTFSIIGLTSFNNGSTVLGPKASARIETFSIASLAVPEPSALTLACAALVAALAADRLRRRRVAPIVYARA